MARKYFSFRSFHRGTVLFEALLVSVILSLAALAVIPLYTGWRSEKRLELAAEEVASAIRQVEILAKNESADYPSMSEGLTFFCETMTDGTGRYSLWADILSDSRAPSLSSCNTVPCRQSSFHKRT